MTFGANDILFAVAMVIFGIEAWRSRSLIALGLTVLALAFLIA